MGFIAEVVTEVAAWARTGEVQVAAVVAVAVMAVTETARWAVRRARR
ncbi:hypothetical protein KVH30_02275 [Streptomyces olivaceus]|nr:hypothetical protein [Streptomyces olivaceus]MBZ6207523.1 hypothetical protein [Streptomyces olivaceus]MBZ6290399.1 hypothetical protein [Streptomyces olivaceus]MBZ6324351.1 hypothetical protein [Streptomyces olivaceus]